MASSGRKTHQAIFRRSSPGCTIAGCSSSRSSPPAISSARGVPSCSCATWVAACTRRRVLWPKKLRGKWLAIVLFVGVLFSLRALRSVGTATGDGVSWSSRTSPRRWRLTSSSRARRSASTSVRLVSSILWRRRCRRSSSRFENGQLASPVARLTASPEGERRRRPAGLCSAAVNWALSTRQGRQHRLHVLPGLRSRLSTRQHCHRGSYAGPRAGRCSPSIRYWEADQPPGYRCCSRCCLCLGRC